MDFDGYFSALPPEINSARMYAGPGSGPMLAAATAWEQLARELNTSAATYRSVVAGLATDGWRGPSSVMMAGSSGRYVDWLHATEADYERMWAQDAVAMHGYAGAASSASTLTPFTAPPTLAQPAPAVDPSTLLSVVLDVPSLTSAAASTTSSTFSGVAIQTTNHALAVNALRDERQGIGPFTVSVAAPVVSAATGRASLAGALSVPQGWAAREVGVTRAAGTAPTAPVIAGSSMTAPKKSAALPPGVFGEAMLGTLAGRGANTTAAKLRRPSVIPRSPAAG